MFARRSKSRRPAPRPPVRRSVQRARSARVRLVGLIAVVLGVVILSVGGLWLWGRRDQSEVLLMPTSTPTMPVPQTPQPSATPVLTPSPSDFSGDLVLDDPLLAAAMLQAINADREAYGLEPVAWDATAALAAANHAADMAAQNYFSHWSPDGHGPQMRYQRVGGLDAVYENIHTYTLRFSDGSPAPIDDFVAVVQEAEVSLMESPGHRRNILTPSHTHVGVGYAYNPQTGSFYLAQEFVDRYVAVEPLPPSAQVGATLVVRGQLLSAASAPLINLTYMPVPQPMTQADLNATGSYQREAEIYAPLNPTLSADGRFEASVSLDYQQLPGIYSVRVWVTVAGEQVLASEQLITVNM